MEDIEKALDNLTSALDRIKNLLAWQKLKQAENSKYAFMSTTTDATEELYNECIFFDYTAEQIERAIESDTEQSGTRLAGYKARLKKLRHNFSGLKINTARYPSNYTAGI